MGYILNQGGSMGFNWKRKVNEKKRRGSQTAGTQKGKHCTADAKERYMAKRNRSYKHPDYEDWSKSHTGHK